MKPRYLGFSRDFVWKRRISATKWSQSGLCWRSVLGLYLFQLLTELVLSHIIQLPQAIDLAQCELAFSKITQARLAVVLRYVLIGAGSSLI